jgi:hypothetical protein
MAWQVPKEKDLAAQNTTATVSFVLQVFLLLLY